MKAYVFLALSLLVSGCGAKNSGDFRSSSEISQDEKKGSVFGEDRLAWKWNQDETSTNNAAQQDPMWVAANVILSEYPISFSNFPSKLIQTGWITSKEKQGLRYRITVRLLGKTPEKENLEVLVFFEQLNGSVWENTPGNTDVKNDISSRILHEALRIFDRQKQD